MKTSRRSLISQRNLIEQKVRKWTELRGDGIPRSGWIKAVRGALGMSTRQLAERVGVDQSNITRLEEREPSGNITLERLARVAKAMNCRLIYAIVPDDRFSDLDAIVNERARVLAQQLVRRTEHSMRLEKQGAHDDDLTKDVDHLANELKSKMDSRIWAQTRP
jgi:predicted DNA-binding mobile mystery protein A